MKNPAEWSLKSKVDNIKFHLRRFDLLNDKDIQDLEDLMNIKNKEIKGRKTLQIQDKIYELVEWWTFDIIPVSPMEG